MLAKTLLFVLTLVLSCLVRVIQKSRPEWIAIVLLAFMTLTPVAIIAIHCYRCPYVIFAVRYFTNVLSASTVLPAGRDLYFTR
ncbi:hypothetical protein VD0004_g9941 [Verticillium dahliae]|nr:hypothetical protein VD0004_g9941 [Verticillium dahliae]PNH42507.1 hypothetical protein VD0003_g9788 [Verticillium dahliae]PNH59288.1 hypothetical protein VD0001_g9933 [Verticillium dahliae]